MECLSIRCGLQPAECAVRIKKRLYELLGWQDLSQNLISCVLYHRGLMSSVKYLSVTLIMFLLATNKLDKMLCRITIALFRKYLMLHSLTMLILSFAILW